MARRLSPLQLAYLRGFRHGARRSLQQGRKEMQALADGFDAELGELRAEVDGLKADYRRYKAFVGSERDPDMMLN